MRQAWCGLLLQSAPAYTVVPVQPPHSLSVYLTEPNDHCSHHLLRAHTVRYAHSLQAWPTVYSTLQQHLQRTLRSCIKKWPCLLPFCTSGHMSDGWDKCDEQEMGQGVSGWVGGESKSHVWAVRTFFVIREEVLLLPLSPISFSEERRDIFKRGV